MLTTEFSNNCYQYTGFQVWEIENISDFFKGNSILATICKDEYKISPQELLDDRSKIQESDIQIMTKLLSLVSDKYFFIFTLHDENHLELVKMQRLKIMNFGVNIEEIRPDRVYVMIMDKKKIKINKGLFI